MTEETGVRAALSKALALEEEGYSFYAESAKKTGDEKGSEMFWWLAGEEKKHFEKITEAWWKNKAITESPASFNPDAARIGHTVFKNTNSSVEDELDALNTGIEAEKASISLYSYLAKRSDMPESARKLFDQLVSEEEKHLAILRGEVEFVTETGEFTDFKAVGA